MASRWLNCSIGSSNSNRDSLASSQRGTQKTTVRTKSKKQLTTTMEISNPKHTERCTQTDPEPKDDSTNKFTFSEPVPDSIMQDHAMRVSEVIQSHVETLIDEMNIEGVIKEEVETSEQEQQTEGKTVQDKSQQTVMESKGQGVQTVEEKKVLVKGLKSIDIEIQGKEQRRLVEEQCCRMEIEAQEREFVDERSQVQAQQQDANTQIEEVLTQQKCAQTNIQSELAFQQNIAQIEILQKDFLAVKNGKFPSLSDQRKLEQWDEISAQSIDTDMSHDIKFNDHLSGIYDQQKSELIKKQQNNFLGNMSPMKQRMRNTMPIEDSLKVKAKDQVVQASEEGTQNAENEEKIALLEKHIRKQKNHHGKKHMESQMLISVKDSQIKMLQNKIAQMERDALEKSQEEALEANIEKSQDSPVKAVKIEELKDLSVKVFKIEEQKTEGEAQEEQKNDEKVTKTKKKNKKKNKSNQIQN